MALGHVPGRSEEALTRDDVKFVHEDLGRIVGDECAMNGPEGKQESTFELFQRI